MRARFWISLLSLALALGAAGRLPADEPAYRTDGGDEKLPWFQLKPGEFPPAGSAHAVSGELIALDHVNRTGVLRVDRNGSQRTDEYDRPLPFALLPYGSIRYHGAPAELRDVPIGTHLHGQFYAQDPAAKKVVFDKAIRLEDDFSRMQSAGRQWKIESIDLGKDTLIVRGVGPGDAADEKTTSFVIRPSTRVWKGRGFGALSDLSAGQMVLLNLTVCTIKGPGRVVDVWLDQESRDVAAKVQLEIHRQYQREHGLAGWVDEVDNQNRIVTMTLFDGFDRDLAKDFQAKAFVAAAVAEETLRTHDQINDVKRGPVLEVLEATPIPGHSGLRIRFKPDELLEGYRPQRILRLFGNGWRVDDLPREESAYTG